MEELKRNDFDPTAKVTSTTDSEPSRIMMMDDFQGLGGGTSGSRDDRRSNSSNVYGSTLGGEGINPFKIKK